MQLRPRAKRRLEEPSERELPRSISKRKRPPKPTSNYKETQQPELKNSSSSRVPTSGLLQLEHLDGTAPFRPDQSIIFYAGPNLDLRISCRAEALSWEQGMLYLIQLCTNEIPTITQPPTTHVQQGSGFSQTTVMKTAMILLWLPPCPHHPSPSRLPPECQPHQMITSSCQAKIPSRPL